MPIIRRSRKRDAMLTLMRSTTCHPSADWVYQRMREQYPDVSLGTVYRFDARISPHSHCVCNQCGAVLDLPNCVSEETIVPFGQEYGFVVQSYEVHIYGTCRECSHSQAV